MRVLYRISGGLLLAATLLLLGAWLWGESTLPRTTGTVTLDALEDDVEVVRDKYGVPHIFAPSWREAYVTLGYLHAADRLWQMELTRRVGAGRLAEVVGEPALKTDKLMRTLGLYQAAADSYFALSTPVQSALQAYAEGVNAFIADGRLPPEYSLAGFTPEPWQPADSLVWLKLMAYTLGSSWRQELTAAALADRLPPQALATLMGWTTLPPALAPADEAKPKEAKPKKENKPKDNSPKTKRGEASAYDWPALLAALPAPPLGTGTTAASASNAWVAGGQRSKSGQPLLANDPHLMLSSPVLWYLARIETPEGSLVGATAPGVPFHVVGMNSELAWGLTTTGADTSDAFVERIGTMPELYLTPNGAEAFLTRREVIKVKGDKDVVLKARQTRHGPVIGDLVDTPLHNGKTTVSLQATYLRSDDTSAEALYWMGRATTVNELQMAMRFVQAPVQNITFAERRGNIGFFTAGTVPVRAKGDGAFPAPGDDAQFDWVGIIPKHDLPRLINPSSGVFGNANEAIVDSHYPYLITATWDAGYRGQRLQQLLGQSTAATPADFAHWQNDTVALPETELRDRLLVLLDGKQVDDNSARVLAALRDWNGRADLNQPGPTIMAIWQEELQTALFADDAGDLLPSLRPSAIGPLLAALRDNDTYDWCDDKRTEAKEDCAHVAIVSLQATAETLDSKLGGDADDWAWRYFNVAPLANKFWQAVPVLGQLFDNSIAVAGGQNTLRRAGRIALTGSDDLYSVNHAAGFRGIYDLANPGDSRFVLATGQSGHVLSRHYDDQTELWARGDYITLSGTLRDLQHAGGDYMTFKSVRDSEDAE